MGLAPPVEKTLVAELMLPAKRSSSESGLIELCEPVLALLAGSSSRRHAGDDTSIENLWEIIQMGPIGPLPASSEGDFFGFAIVDEALVKISQDWFES